MKHILVATDLSERSQHAVRRAALLALLAQSSLNILHVVDDAFPGDFIDAQVKRAQAWLSEHIPVDAGLPVPNLIVRQGDPHEQILKVAGECGADLIVLGGHRRRQLLDGFLGTTAERLLRVSTRPVLIVHDAGLDPYRRVYIGTDLSTPSAHAFAVTRRLGLLGSHPSVVHVFVAVGVGKLRSLGIDPAPLIARERDAASQRLISFIADLEVPGTDVAVVLREGRATQQILRVVSDERAQLLVMGTRGRAGATRAVLGSVTEAVLRAVQCDVLAVPAATDRA